MSTLKIRYTQSIDGLNWTGRTGLAAASVILCGLLFVFTAHTRTEQHTATEAQAAINAHYASIAEEFRTWQAAKEPAYQNVADKITVPDLSELVSYTSTYGEIAEILADERRCMSEAIYHEAGFESVMGQMAVADVILNRVKSTHYPDSICAVVYEGSYRKTGCQFSFTCDGSLKKKRNAKAFTKSKELAGAILAGIHMPVSKDATHYHADYVSPYWAPKLVPTAQIGAHKFYKFPKRTTITAAAQ